MTHAFLIARQEFVKYVTRRGFLLSILMFPIWIMIVIFVPQWTGGGGAASHVFTVIDRTGGAVRDTILADLARGQAQDAARWTYVAPPVSLATAPDARFDADARRALSGDRGAPYFDTLIVIPKDFAAARLAQIWSENKPDAAFRDFVEGTLTQVLQLAAVRRVAPQVTDPSILDVAAHLQARDPRRAPGADSVAADVVPIALAIILFVVSVMNSSVLLQGVVEEKSTRMIEVLLSCATPREITSGKLLGVIAVAIATLLIWALVLFVLMALASSGTVALVLTSLKAVASLGTLPLLLLFFLCGLLIYGSLFLAIGSMASSLADAQSLLGPSMLILMLPNLMISGVIQAPNGALASTLSWVPIYTPFFMMLRITSHPPAWQLWGTTALALATTVAMIWWTGRIFAKHVLTTERPPSLGVMLRGLIGRS